LTRRKFLNRPETLLTVDHNTCPVGILGKIANGDRNIEKQRFDESALLSDRPNAPALEGWVYNQVFIMNFLN